MKTRMEQFPQSTFQKLTQCRLILIAITCLLLCGAINRVASAKRAARKVVTLERTPCFGACPVYKLTIFSNGTVIYEGKQNVRRPGKATGRISQERLQELIADFMNIDYFNLHDEYVPGTEGCPKAATDQPSAITSLTRTRDGKSKTIRHYHGCRGSDTLELLTQLEDKIDTAVNINRWIK